MSACTLADAVKTLNEGGWVVTKVGNRLSELAPVLTRGAHRNVHPTDGLENAPAVSHAAIEDGVFWMKFIPASVPGEDIAPQVDAIPNDLIHSADNDGERIILFGKAQISNQLPKAVGGGFQEKTISVQLLAFVHVDTRKKRLEDEAAQRQARRLQEETDRQRRAQEAAEKHASEVAQFLAKLNADYAAAGVTFRCEDDDLVVVFANTQTLRLGIQQDFDWLEVYINGSSEHPLF